MEKTFESSLNELEKIVKQLEDGDLPLETSLKLFETGVKLSRECREQLTQAERRIEVLMKDAGGNLTLESLDDDTSRESSKPQVGKRIVFSDDEEEDLPF
ncbi:MAG: exodeoxyribonuclease VII small subunit [Saprospiraceae bacterium]|nr:exodeoxyribonuclease VII small subunit [Pyrinomonadaceae bacterium]